MWQKPPGKLGHIPISREGGMAVTCLGIGLEWIVVLNDDSDDDNDM